MAWGQLAVDKPHLVYIILGGFTSLFMLCSSVIKERLYIGEATVATLCGIIFGPHAANLINPGTWGNTDMITLEFSRIVLVVQCFAVGVELPKSYMEKHWKSVVFLLVPVMTVGWLLTSLFIWGLLGDSLNWLDSLVCAACVTATDPVLASSVVGKGKFAKRVPKHLRDILSAESGCNDGMAFPFIYLALYLVQLDRNAGEVTWHWIGITILYECIFGAIYGVVVGYIARRAIRYAHERDLIDRESFLVFYFVLALFCAGSGSMLGIDDLLVGFSCGVGFSNDGWFGEKTEESHVSNVIDLLINLSFFVYFGTIIPWDQYNSAALGTSPWRMVVIAVLVLLFRRIPIMMLLKPVIPDVKTWREALFAGHFGPIGVGAIFVAIMARAELETETTTPLAVLPGAGFPHDNIIQLIWPLTTFLVMASIVVHGSSIAVFTLGKHINTLTITMSYTQAQDDGNWMDRLPRIQSRSRTSISMRKPDMSEESLNEKLPDYPAAALGLPRNFLRRQKEEDNPSRASSISRKWRRENGIGAGGPVEQSAISPVPRSEAYIDSRSGSDTLAPKEESSEIQDKEMSHESGQSKPQAEVYEEGKDTVIEDEEGNVLEVMRSKEGESRHEREKRVEEEVKTLLSDEEAEAGMSGWKSHSPLGRRKSPEVRKPSAPEESRAELERMPSKGKGVRQLMESFGGLKKDKTQQREEKPPQAGRPKPQAHKSGPARAYRFGRTIILEDEDGEVIKKFDIPAPEKKPPGQPRSYADPERTRQRLHRMGTWLGVSHDEDATEDGPPSGQKKKRSDETDDDDRIRFTVDGQTQRMNKADFIRQIEAMHPQKRAHVVEQSSANELVKQEARADAAEHDANLRHASAAEPGTSAAVERVASHQDADRRTGPDGLTVVDSHDNDADIPYHSFAQELRGRETAAQRRRRAAGSGSGSGSAAVQPQQQPPTATTTDTTRLHTASDEEETAAERRRREGALGVSTELSDSDSDGARRTVSHTQRETTGADGRRREATRHTERGRPSVDDAPEETAAERRRREAALGVSHEPRSEVDGGGGGGTSSRDGETAAESRRREAVLGVPESPPIETRAVSMGIRFADPVPRGRVGREREREGGEREEGEGVVGGGSASASGDNMEGGSGGVSGSGNGKRRLRWGVNRGK